ncbi:type III secretion system outer membrane ring subunit SctC [Robbsia sp. KACC 23696]|uniref:type III secretion system outer membrane ring subunit SctC n=1 Tax=Robbsia sp. KACC 23696 TaxID=3149231 RepID=UPI00325C046A
MAKPVAPEGTMPRRSIRNAKTSATGAARRVARIGTRFNRHAIAAAATATVLATIAATPSTASAAPIPWRTMQLDYVADHKALRDVLRDVSASAGVPVWISPKVEGNVTGHFQTSPQQLLNRMSASFGFVWYYDGSVLRIYDSSEMTSTTIGLRTATMSELRRTLARLETVDPRFPLRYDDATRTALVSGPPRYVELVSDISKLVDQNHQASQRDQGVRIFPLRYAWAEDHTITVDGQTIRITGVASILRSLYSEQGGPIGSQTAPESDARRLRNVAESAGGGGTADIGYGGGSRARAQPQSNNGTWTTGLPGLLGGGGGAAPSGPFPQNGVGMDGDGGGGGGVYMNSRRSGGQSIGIDPSDAPVITPDPRTNSILIRGAPDHMAAFESLIASLDVRPAVVEIDASIIEITDTALKQLGVDWRAHSSHGDIEIGNGQNVQGSTASVSPNGFPNLTSTTTSTTSAVAATPVGGVFTAVLGGAGKYLMARISALEQTDQATVNASPKVATLDNVEAVMDNKQTFYVPVSGYQSADLYSISAGVSLRVLPMIVRGSGMDEDGGGPSRMRLNVHIEDGQLTTQTVSNLPVVSKSTIDTQALISQGQSLLIAGYEVNQDERTGTGVPGLSKIPLIGGLFKYKSHTGQKFQRLFLVTPHILVAGGPRDDPMQDPEVSAPPMGYTDPPDMADQAVITQSRRTFEQAPQDRVLGPTVHSRRATSGPAAYPPSEDVRQGGSS